MKYPLTIVDNFYSNPDEIRDYALSLPYYDNRGYQPGRKTDGFAVLNTEFNKHTCEKLLSVYYNLDYDDVTWDIRSEFQITEPMHEDKNAPINNGWIHQDYNRVLAAICYLNPNPDPESGTSFFTPKEKVTDDWREQLMQECSLRFDAFSSFGVKYDVDVYNKTFTNHRNKFNEVLQVKNVYNRLIIFDANYWHAQNTLMCNDQPRLTQVFFANKIESISPTPYERLNNIL